MSPRLFVPFFLLAAAAVYAVLAAGLLVGPGITFNGTKIYDYYFLALTEGRFDIPVRIIGLEGHYDQSGRAYVYHGIAPMLTRLVAWPFVDLQATTIMTALTVWVFAFGGTLAYYLGVRDILERYATPEQQGGWHLLLGLMVWVTSPGWLLVCNQALFHEPIAVAYFCAAWSVYFHMRVVLHDVPPARVAVPLALLAALAVFARPHVAVGLYAGLGLLGLVHLRRDGTDRIGIWVTTVLILGLAGLGFLSFNAARFGDPLRMFGDNQAGVIEYGFIFWGLQDGTTPRIAAFVEHGTFNLKRILPNLMIYAIDVPRSVVSLWVQNAYRAMTLDTVGFIRIETPRVGFAWLWMPWLALPVLALFTPRLGPWRGTVPVIATAVITLMILSYGTITLRYRFEVFALIAVLALLALPRLLAGGASVAGWLRGLGRALLLLSLAGAVCATLWTTWLYRHKFERTAAEPFWSYETCREYAVDKGFTPDDIERICAL